jgi:hypothetical protein
MPAAPRVELIRAVNERSGMDDLRIRAQFVGLDAANAGASTIGTVMSRAEFAETAAQGEFPATLLLELDRLETGDGGEVTAHARVAVDWDKDTLDRLLASTEEEEIGLWFDERELALAFDEVEGHGLREKAAVLAVAAAAAGAGATPALASPFSQVTDGDAGGAPATGVVAPATPAGPMGAVRGVQMDQQLSGSQSPGTGGSVASTPSASTPSSSTPSAGELAGLAAGAALLISAAGFGVARRRTPPAQPA